MKNIKYIVFGLLIVEVTTMIGMILGAILASGIMR